MTARIRVNGIAGDTVSALDRGLAYGDGLFESIRLVGASAPLWLRHAQRLTLDCRRLGLPVPDTAQLWREARAVSEGLPAAVVRISLTRGVGARGYAPPASPQVTRVVAAFAPPPLPPDLHTRMATPRVWRSGGSGGGSNAATTRVTCGEAGGA